MIRHQLSSLQEPEFYKYRIIASFFVINMVLETVIKTNGDHDWNKRLVGNKYATVHQTTDYAEYIKKISNQPSFYITFEHKSDIVGQLILHKISRLKRRLEFKMGNIPFSSTFLELVNNIKPLYVWHFGPSIFDENFRRGIYSEIVKFPKIFKAPIKGSLHPLDNTATELINNNWKEKKMATILINLTLSEDQLWKNIDRHSGRKAVKRALSKGVKIKPIKDLADLKIHHLLLNEGMEIAKLGRYPFKYLEASWYMLKNVGQFGFIAWHNDTPLASTLVTTFNGYINEWGFARSKFDRDHLVGGSDLIKWHIIQWGHKRGFRIFDLSGVDPASQNKKDQGIFRFKKKWGGTLQDWYHYSIDY